MGIGIITNFDISAPKNIDSRLGPYATADQATGSIPDISRYIGMTVIVTGSGVPVEYWFNPTINNADLVLKSRYGTINSTISTNSQLILLQFDKTVSYSIFIEYQLYYISGSTPGFASRAGTIKGIYTEYTENSMSFTENSTEQYSSYEPNKYDEPRYYNTEDIYFSFPVTIGVVDFKISNSNKEYPVKIKGEYKLLPL
jgi:hypothetical protein